MDVLHDDDYDLQALAQEHQARDGECGADVTKPELSNDRHKVRCDVEKAHPRHHKHLRKPIQLRRLRLAIEDRLEKRTNPSVALRERSQRRVVVQQPINRRFGDRCRSRIALQLSPIAIASARVSKAGSVAATSRTTWYVLAKIVLSMSHKWPNAASPSIAVRMTNLATSAACRRFALFDVYSLPLYLTASMSK